MKALRAYQRPLSLLQDLQEEMSNLFGRGLGQDVGSFRGTFDLLDETPSLGVTGGQWSPRVDITEEATQYRIYADIPGIDPKAIHVTVENNKLIISGERSIEYTTNSKQNYTRAERFFGSFYRSFSLPDTADSTKVQATVKNGVLEITLPKRSSNTTKQIEVKISG